MALLEKKLYVKKSTLEGAGKGLFTKVLIPAGTNIVEYKGKLTTWKEVNHNDGENGYIYFVKRSHVIDASRTLSALARYANDASGLVRKKGVTNNAIYAEEGVKVFIQSKKDILPGSEIFVGYGKDYWNVIRHNIKVEKQRQKEREAAAKKTKKKK